MIYDHVGGIRDALKALEFCRNKEKVMIILTETHVSDDPIQKK